MEQKPGSSQPHFLRCHSIGAPGADWAAHPAQWISCVIPADGTTAHVSGVGGNARCSRNMSVSAPFIAIVPAWVRIKPNHDDDPRGLVVALNSARLRDTARKALGTAACEIPHWFAAWDPFLREAADTLTALHAGRSPEPMCLAAFADVFALHLARRYGHSTGTHDAGTRLTQSKLSAVNHFIHEHIAENIRIEDLAALVHTSPSHFARAFKCATGHPPHFYLITERVRLAQSMLSNGSLPLVDVAARAGFQTQQHFTEVFHRYTGCTPRAFRLAHHRPTSISALAD
jgi:AraC family transcriptional regulator